MIPFHDKNWLIKELEYKRPSEIAKEQNVSASVISYYIKKLDITIDKKHHSKNWLIKKYVDENLSMREIGELTGCSASNISILLKKFGIKKEPDKVVATRINTMLKRYDGPTPLESKFLLEKINHTKMEKYGTTNTSKLLQTKMKLPKTIDIFGRPANEWSEE